MAVIGWKLDREDRAALLDRFPPEWPDVDADHITLDAGADEDTPLPGEVRAEIVGSADDGRGLQAMVVAVDGTTDRPDGSTYHITWSLDRAQGRKPVESNEVIAAQGWRPLEQAMPITVTPARWP